VISDFEFAKAIEELAAKNGFKEMLIISESCSAFTIFDSLEVPNIYMIGSSSFDEKSYSHGNDALLGLAKVDYFSLKTYEFANDYLDASLDQYMGIWDPIQLNGHPEVKNTFKKKRGSDLRLVDFLASPRRHSSKLLNFRNPDEDTKQELKFVSKMADYLNATTNIPESSQSTGQSADDSTRSFFHLFKPAQFLNSIHQFSL